MFGTFVLAASLAMLSANSYDPSLTHTAACGSPTALRSAVSAPATCDGQLLDYDGIELQWDEAAQSFSLSLDGAFVADLVTSTDSKGRQTFTGLGAGDKAAVYGNVAFASDEKWIVDITRPGHKPERFDVIADNNVAVAIAAQRCECADRIGLTCKSNDCVNGNSCSAGASTCKYVPVQVID